MINRRILLAAAGLGVLGSPALAATGPSTRRTLKTSDGRVVETAIWKAEGRSRGLILFSHGALSAPRKYDPLLLPWQAAGFDIAAPLHVDSTDHPDHARHGMVDSWRARLLDMRAVADAFAGDKPYVAAGHSYGGLVAVTLGGVSAERPAGLEGPMADPRVKCVVAFSPPGPTPGLISAEGFKTLAVPALIQTGTLDNPPGGEWRVHLAAFDNAPAGDKYGLVLSGVDHYFGRLICRPERDVPAQTPAMEQAVAVSKLFLSAYGLDRKEARRSLNAMVGETPAAILLKR